ncbi:MAG: RraA family protein [Leifsonia sp.]
MPESYSLDEVTSRLYTAVLSDVLDSVGCTGQVAEPGLRPLSPDMRLAGYARTARAVSVSSTPQAPYAKLLEAIDGMSGDDVLVLALQPSSQSAIFGGLLATAVNVAGARGVVVDGYARDASEIQHIGLPTFAKGLMPLDSAGRDEVVEVEEAVALGGVLVHPGDLIVADLDGVVVVPSALEQTVLRLAFEKVAGEGEVRHALRGGMPTAEAFAKYGIL